MVRSAVRLIMPSIYSNAAVVCKMLVVQPYRSTKGYYNMSEPSNIKTQHIETQEVKNEKRLSES